MCGWSSPISPHSISRPRRGRSRRGSTQPRAACLATHADQGFAAPGTPPVEPGGDHRAGAGGRFVQARTCAAISRLRRSDDVDETFARRESPAIRSVNMSRNSQHGFLPCSARSAAAPVSPRPGESRAPAGLRRSSRRRARPPASAHGLAGEAAVQRLETRAIQHQPSQQQATRRNSQDRRTAPRGSPPRRLPPRPRQSGPSSSASRSPIGRILQRGNRQPRASPLRSVLQKRLAQQLARQLRRVGQQHAS